MPLLRNTLDVQEDHWLYSDDDAELPNDSRDNHQHRVVSLSRYLQLINESDSLPEGVKLAPDDQTDELAPFVDQLKLICIDFPTFTDGRGYSHARLLRQRFGYTGELRAVGDVRPDQILFMQRLGIDAFDCTESLDLAHLRQLVTRFGQNYQPSYPLPAPI